MIEASLLDEKTNKVISAYRTLRQADPTFDTLQWFGMRTANGEPVMSQQFHLDLPYLGEGEQVLWHRERTDGVFNKKLAAFEALTNYRAYHFDFTRPFALGQPLFELDIAITNRKTYSESQRNSTFGGSGARGIFVGSSTGQSYGESQTFGDINLIEQGSIVFTYYGVADPQGLVNLIKVAMKSQHDLMKQFDELRAARGTGPPTKSTSRAETRCPQCNSLNEIKSKFCNQCGASLKNTCPKCNHSNEIGAKFCAECGSPLT
jgi:hypothetical protein